MENIVCFGIECIKVDAEKTLLDANMQWALGDLLAIEKHLVELGKEDIKHSWCIKKHFTHLTEHALSEAIEHSTKVDKELSEKLKEFKKKVEEIMKAPTLEKVRQLRNELRVLMKDETLEYKCPLCELDK
jgi:hypothetical protein